MNISAADPVLAGASSYMAITSDNDLWWLVALLCWRILIDGMMKKGQS